MLPHPLPSDPKERIAVFSAFFEDYCSYCRDLARPLPQDRVEYIRKQLYLARYGGADIADLESEIRALMGGT